MADISKIQIESGIYNIKDETARQEIANINSQINRLQNERIVCIGDSYGVGTTYGGTIEGWIDRLKTMRNISNDNFFKLAEGSSGFTRVGLQGHTFLSLLEANINNITDKNSITKIIVCGGHNEYDSDQQALNSAIQYFIEYCKTNFPNAQIYVGMIGNNSNNTAFGKNVRNAIYNFILRCYQNCVVFGANYIKGIQNIMHDYQSFMSEDGIHPNNLGYNFITSYLNSALNGQNVDFIGNVHRDTFTALNSSSEFLITSRIANDVIMFDIPLNIAIHYDTPFTWNRGAYLDLANKTPSNFAFHNEPLKIPVDYYVQTNDNPTKFYGGIGLLEFKENLISIRNTILINDGTAYFDIPNVTDIIITPRNVTIDVGLC